MALATLCHEMRIRDSAWSNKLTGFIVDHGLRPGSHVEAYKVADELEKLQIKPVILSLEWPGHQNPSRMPNLESMARKLRYQALGRACRNRGISSLLLGHHADDQAETALLRIVSGYTGAGLIGIRASGHLPECHGFYGVNQSGRPLHRPQDLSIEGGGVDVHRPLLDVDKSQLMEFCREHDTRWFEDPTNTDVTLTLRNAIRHLLQNADELPRALRKPRLLSVASTRLAEREEEEAQARKLFARVQKALDVRTGRIEFTLDRSTQEQMAVMPNIARHLLRLLLQTVSSKSSINISRDLHEALALAISSDDGIRAKKGVHAAGAHIKRSPTKSNDSRFLAFRPLPAVAEQSNIAANLWTAGDSVSDHTSRIYEQWHLWEGRYWVRVLPPQNGTTSSAKIVVRLLNADGLEKLRHMSAEDGWARRTLEQVKTAAAHEVRVSLPAIYVVHPDSSGSFGSGQSEELVAVPSFGCHAPGWTKLSREWTGKLWAYDIRYKHVDLEKDEVLSVRHEETSRRLTRLT